MESNNFCKCEPHFEMPRTTHCSRCHEPYNPVHDELARLRKENEELAKQVSLVQITLIEKLESKIKSLEAVAEVARSYVVNGTTHSLMNLLATLKRLDETSQENPDGLDYLRKANKDLEETK